MLRIEVLRIERGLSPTMLARVAGVNEGFCSTIRHGRVNLPPDSITLRRLSRALSWPTADAGALLDDVEEG